MHRRASIREGDSGVYLQGKRDRKWRTGAALCLLQPPLRPWEASRWRPAPACHIIGRTGETHAKQHGSATVFLVQASITGLPVL